MAKFDYGAEAPVAPKPHGMSLSAGSTGVGVITSQYKKIGQAGANLGKDAVSNNGGLTAIMAVTFAIVGLAKIRGQAKIDTKHALFGGFVLLFLLTIMYKIKPAIALGFAFMVLWLALMEYGPAALGGIFGKANAPTTAAEGAAQGYSGYGPWKGGLVPNGTNPSSPAPTTPKPSGGFFGNPLNGFQNNGFFGDPANGITGGLKADAQTGWNALKGLFS